MSNHDTPTAACGCATATTVDQSRRRIIRIAVAGLAAGISASLSFADEDIQILTGDRLVLHTTKEEPVALKADDIKPGKVMLAYPFDPASKKIRNESRLSKVLLVRAVEAQMNDETKRRSAGGVLAFSGVCTHAGCDVSAWMANFFACRVEGIGQYHLTGFDVVGLQCHGFVFRGVKHETVSS